MSDLTEAQRDSLNECECGDFLNEHSPEGCLGTDYANDDDLCMCLRSPDEIRANAIVAMLAAERDALLAKFEALAEAWADVLAECKAADPKWILDRSVVALDTARRDLCAVIKEARA